jgi:uncharacterized protein (DUF1501 family)
MPRLAFARPETTARGDVLVCIFLRGAADGLNIIIPHGDNAYYQQRPTLAISHPDNVQVDSEFRVIDLDGFFGLHPSLAPLLPIWAAGHLAPVHAVGSPDESRSHFKAMELMERGVDQPSGPPSGWLARHLATLDTLNRSPIRGITIGEMVARSLQGSVPAAALRSIADYHLGGDDAQALAEIQAALSALYKSGDPLDILAAEALFTLETINSLDSNGYEPANGADYPDGEFGAGLEQVAMLIKAEVGLEVACLDLGGWDTHIAQGSTQGAMPILLDELAQGLRAFYTDLAEQADRFLVVVMSEFGRRVKENGGLGTDHGHGGVMLLLGGNVVGGRVHGDWPGLAPGQLVGPGDLAVTTDYRDVLAEVVARRLKNPQLEAVFPGYTPTFRDLLIP